MVCTCGHQWRAPAFSSKRLEGTIKFQWFSHRDYYFSRSAMACLHHLFTFSVYSDSFYWTDIHFVCQAVQFSSVTQSCPTLRPHESQHARTPCPSSTPGVHSDSRSSSQWYHPAISSSVVPFSSCPQSLPASASMVVMLDPWVNSFLDWAHLTFAL